MLSTAKREKKDLAMVKQDGLALQHVKNQTKDIIVAAIKQNPFALQFVIQQPQGLCLAVVTRWPEALKCVRDQALGICLAASVRNRKVLQFVRDEEVREKARCILDLPGELSPEIDKAGYAHDEALAACGKRLMKLFHVPKVDPNTDKIDPDAYELLVSDGEYLADFTAAEQTPEMCLMAMVNEPAAFLYVQDQIPELWYHKICYFSEMSYSIWSVMRFAVVFYDFGLLVVCSRFLSVKSSFGIMGKRDDSFFYATLFSLLVQTVNIAVCFCLVVSLYFFIKAFSMVQKAMTAKVILLYNNETAFSKQTFHEMVAYVVPLEFTDSQEFADDALYLTNKIVRIFSELCSKYKRIRKALPIFMELGRCYARYRSKRKEKIG